MATVVNFNLAGTPICNQGDPGDAFFVVLQGTLRVLKKNAETGLRDEVGQLGSGDVMGQHSLLSGLPRSATVIVEQQATLLWVAKTDYDAIIKPFHVRDTQRKMDFLRSMYLFIDYSSEDMKALSQVLVIRRLATGSIIVLEGQPSSDMMFIMRGQAQVFKRHNAAAGNAKSLRSPTHHGAAKNEVRVGDTLDNSTVVGELWKTDIVDPHAVVNKDVYSYSAIAATVLDVLVLPAAEMRRVLFPDTMHKVLTRARAFPTTEELHEHVRKHAEWRNYTAQLVRDCLYSSPKRKELLLPRYKMARPNGYATLPLTAEFTNAAGQTVPLAATRRFDPMKTAKHLKPFRTGSSLGGALFSSAADLPRHHRRARSVSPSRLMGAKVEVSMSVDHRSEADLAKSPSKSRSSAPTRSNMTKVKPMSEKKHAPREAPR
mmetsp:Transcript_18140/g.43385  ORF Transcript_18140/g.43385 Transcript_18140/m.43385 type:complete len:430 (+) Transcript_18140:430-1719(+)